MRDYLSGGHFPVGAALIDRLDLKSPLALARHFREEHPTLAVALHDISGPHSTYLHCSPFVGYFSVVGVSRLLTPATYFSTRVKPGERPYLAGQCRCACKSVSNRATGE